MTMPLMQTEGVHEPKLGTNTAKHVLPAIYEIEVHFFRFSEHE